jgi:hypothetical protein
VGRGANNPQVLDGIGISEDGRGQVLRINQSIRSQLPVPVNNQIGTIPTVQQCKCTQHNLFAKIKNKTCTVAS